MSSTESYNNHKAEIGARIRQARKRKGLSLRDLASASGLSSSFLSLVERGESSPSLTSLFTITKALDIYPTDVIDGPTHSQQSKSEYGIWREDFSDKNFTVLGERKYYPFSRDSEDAALKPIFLRILPSETANPLQTHEGEEVAVVVTGILTLNLRSESIELGPGDAIHFHSEVPHSIENRTASTVEAIWISTNDSPHLLSHNSSDQ